MFKNVAYIILSCSIGQDGFSLSLLPLVTSALLKGNWKIGHSVDNEERRILDFYT